MQDGFDGRSAFGGFVVNDISSVDARSVRLSVSSYQQV